ncbi:bifunctional Delta(1)-pyrroline-2-carboxylate/Delta(1)-piperideine-2-carboxylate reductase [Caballeronia sp. BR00000012568055]|uniref:bifunctional Delta(1)-pyrroline-2-carboxylate/Delta(1)-piperideine-2- carboxylate reductase n=1 Tax=Caballeronia sp. BR00000012568055 TaxID=2918761 RepID=UPI0023F9E6E8|nr:bifunctional Delta(1)-pyrroline-2-carboxylate/Delta(1)-piperideine-2-carboxylate reductase [Caballeronia sp. BR00000012568055]
MTIPSFDADQTATLLPYDRLVDTLAATMLDYAAGRITSPERMVVPLAEGGVMLSMPASAADLAMHKLVNVCPGNGARNLPTIHGQVTAFDAVTGVPQFMLDGPTVTGRRTAAVSMLAIRTLAQATPREVLMIGTGKQAAYHADALASIYPGARIHVLGSRAERAQAFCADHAQCVPLDSSAIPDSIDIVIAATTSKTPVYTLPARAGRLVIGVGAFTADAAEIAAPTVHASALYVDDPAGARHEAGDFILADVDWNTVQPLSAALASPSEVNKPRLFKSVGCAAWDLAACRVARAVLSTKAFP